MLRQVTLPQVADHASRRATESAISGLVLIAEAWPRILPFLVWDNTEMIRLLQERDVATPTTPATPDVEAHDQLNEDLRRRLEALLARHPASRMLRSWNISTNVPVGIHCATCRP